MNKNDTPTIHRIKLSTLYFDDVWSNLKKFEIRFNDRNYQVGDTVYLCEFDSSALKYTGRELRTTITYILRDFVGVSKDYIAFGFKIEQFKEP